MATVNAAKDAELIAATEDTSNVCYDHLNNDELGYVAGSNKTNKRGIIMHSVLLVNIHTQRTIVSAYIENIVTFSFKIVYFLDASSPYVYVLNKYY